MKKICFLLSLVLICTLGNGQNALLKGAVNGNPIVGGGIYGFDFAWDGSDLALLISDYPNGKIHAIDFNASTSAGVEDWTTGSVEKVMDKIAAILGAKVENLEVRDMEMNPKTNSVMILVEITNIPAIVLVQVKSETNISLVDPTNVTYASINYSSNGNYLFDMEWGTDGKLYFCTGDFSLDAEVGLVEPPFIHNTSATLRSTSVFKSNWGGSYFTEAPLEMISMTSVEGVDRLLGVTTCAPGFSIPVSEVQVSPSVLSITEDFNVHYDYSKKVVAVTQNIGGVDKSFLFDLHLNTASSKNQLVRIGHKFLNGSRAAKGEINGSAQRIRTNSGAIVSSLPEEDASEISFGYRMVAKYDDYHLMVIDENDELRLLDVSATGVGVNERSAAPGHIKMFPVPAKDHIQLVGSFEATQYSISSMNGKEVREGVVNNNRIELEQLPKGNYVLILYQNNRLVGSESFHIID